MKYRKLAIFGLMLIGLGAKIEASETVRRFVQSKQAARQDAANRLVNDINQAASNVGGAVTGVFKRSGDILPDVCRFINDATDKDGKAISVWMRATDDLNALWTEVKSGQQHTFKGKFTVTTRDPKKIYIAMVGITDTFQIDPLTDCHNHQLKFSDLKKTRQVLSPAHLPLRQHRRGGVARTQEQIKQARTGTPPL
jgi:hypothetical protein